MRRKVVLSAIFAVALLGGFAFGARDFAQSPQSAEASPTTVTIYWGQASGTGCSTPYYKVNGFDQTPQLDSHTPPCYDCYLTNITPDLEYDTTPASPGDGPWARADFSNGGQLHHMVFFNTPVKDATCGQDPLFGNLGERFFASGNERSVWQPPAGYGYYLPPGPDPNNYWFMQVMIHNLTPSTQYYRLKMTFTFQPATDNVKALRPLWLDEVNCGNSQYPVR